MIFFLFLESFIISLKYKLKANYFSSYRDVSYSRPPPSRPKQQPWHDPPARVPESDHFYPGNDDFENSRITSPPRRVSNNPSTRKDYSIVEDASQTPIRFPEPYEFSVPRPKVPGKHGFLITAFNLVAPPTN